MTGQLWFVKTASGDSPRFILQLTPWSWVREGREGSPNQRLIILMVIIFQLREMKWSVLVNAAGEAGISQAGCAGEGEATGVISTLSTDDADKHKLPFPELLESARSWARHLTAQAVPHPLTKPVK